MKQVNYIEYEHSYAHVIAPKLKTLNYHANVGKKPLNYLKKIVTHLVSQPSVYWTDKEHEFMEEIDACVTAQQIYYRCKAAVEKARETIVIVNDNGELADCRWMRVN